MEWETLLGITILFHGAVYAWRRQWLLRLTTRRLNGFLNGVAGSWTRKPLRIWFRIGSILSLAVGLPATVVLLLRTLFVALGPWSVEDSTTSTVGMVSASLGMLGEAEVGGGVSLRPLVPGWNLPLSELPIYALALLFSVASHELGHAFAAAAYQVPVVSVGVSLFGPLLPSAHVELASGPLSETRLARQIDVFLAGVWTNVVIGAFCLLVIPPLLPLILLPTHSLNTGISVTAVLPRSGAGGPGGLLIGDAIISVEECGVTDVSEWLGCLQKTWHAEASSYCVQINLLESNQTDDCCGLDGDNSATHLCFMDAKNETEACLPAKQTTNGPKCSESCGDSVACLFPRIVKIEPRFRVINIHRVEGEPVLFVGDIVDLARGLKTSPFVSRFLPWLLARLPSAVETLVVLTAGLSAGLAVVNTLPIYGLDGYHVADAFLRAKFPRAASRLLSILSWSAVLLAISALGSSLLFQHQ